MADGWRNFSKSDVCPICGGPDWCGWSPLGEDDKRVILCFRDTYKQSFATGGRYYKYTKDSSGSGGSVYCDLPSKEQKEGQRAVYNRGAYKSRALKPEGIIEPAPAEILDSLYRKLQELLVLEKHHREYLHAQGWTDEMIAYYHIVSFPEKDEFRKKYNNRNYCRNRYRSQLCKEMMKQMEGYLGPECLRGMPGAFQTSDGIWTLFGPSGILFPVFDGEGRVVRMRLRKDFEDVDAKVYGTGENKYFFDPKTNEKIFICMKGHYRIREDGTREYLNTSGKYRYLHSFIQDRKAEKEGILKNFLSQGVQVQNLPSIYTRPQDDKTLWFICEGEPKSMFSNWYLERPFIDIPGVSSWAMSVTDEMIAYMKAQGMRGVCIAFDADQFDMVVHRSVRLFAISLMLRLMDCGVKVVEALWDEKIAKGLDDLLAAGHFPTFRYPKREDLLAERERIQNMAYVMADTLF